MEKMLRRFLEVPGKGNIATYYEGPYYMKKVVKKGKAVWEKIPHGIGIEYYVEHSEVFLIHKGNFIHGKPDSLSESSQQIFLTTENNNNDDYNDEFSAQPDVSEANLTVSEHSDNKPNNTDNEWLDNELDKVIGLSRVKKELKESYHTIQIEARRKSLCLPQVAPPVNFAFMGEPGTAKTTIAKLCAQLLFRMGLLRRAEPIVTTSDSWIAEYTGQTASKARKLIEQALSEGRLLFIDEAYTISDTSGYGSEAIGIITHAMTEHPELRIIIAGYPAKLEEFIDSNEGLRSRFSTKITFEPYTYEELFQIGLKMYKDKKFNLSEEASQVLKNYCIQFSKYKNNGNGRLIQNVFHDSYKNQCTRLISASKNNLEDLSFIEPADIFPAAEKHLNELENKNQREVI